MKVMHRGIILSLIVLLSFICCCCSKENDDVVDSNKKSIDVGSNFEAEDGYNGLVNNGLLDKSEEQGDKDISLESDIKDTDRETEEDIAEETKKEDASPWRLISESSVNTKVDYAGFLNESIGITVGYAGAISYTADGGKSWSESSNVSACRYGLDLYDENFFVSSGNSGVNLLSIDKGESWSSLADFPLKNNDEFNKFISVIDKENIYVGSKLSLGVSDDGGETWSELKLVDECNNIVGMFFMTPEIGYLLNSDGRLYMTKDGCETWTVQAIDLGGEKIAINKMPSAVINFQNNEEGIIIYTTTSYKVCCIGTEDGASTWENISMPKVSCFAPYLSRDGQFLTLSSSLKKVCLYKMESD